MLVRSNIFPQFVEKVEKLKLVSLTKQRNIMRKKKSEMLKTRKKGKTIRLGKNCRKIFPGTRKISEISRDFFENFPFPGKLKTRQKGKP